MHYVPPPTIDEYMQSDKFARFVIGPLGSGKSLGNIMELFRRAAQQAPDARGIRPTRFAVIRNTMDQLRKTCLTDTREAFEGGGVQYKVYESTLYFNMPLPDGTLMRSEWLYLPIDSQEDTRRLLSLQLTGAWASEFRELNYEVVSAVLGRLGRYPSAARVKPTWQGLIAESNPFPLGSEWYEHLVVNKPSNWGFWQQPGGLDPAAENRQNLPADYYERLMEGNNPDWIDVHVHGKFGPDQSGRAVFYSSFDHQYHTAHGLQWHDQSPIMISFDFGRTPCALICQEDARGRLLILDEVTSEDCGIEQFIKEYLRPKLADKGYSRARMFCVGDPSGAFKSQVNELSPFDVVRGAGFHVHPAGSNKIEPRIRSVESLLLQNRGGGSGRTSALLMDADNCPMLVRAMASEYKFKRLKTGRVEDLPCKDHPWSDLADALQYACMAVNSSVQARHMRMMAPAPERSAIPASGWT